MRPVRRLCRHRSVRAEEIHGGLSARVGRHERPFPRKIKPSKKFGVFRKTRDEIHALDGQQEKALGLLPHPGALHSGRQRRPRKGLWDFGRKFKQGLQKNSLDFSALYQFPPDSTRKCRPCSR